MADTEQLKEQLKLAVQILARIADRAKVDGPDGRQRDQAIQILASHHGLEAISPQSEEPPQTEASEDSKSESN